MEWVESAADESAARDLVIGISPRGDLAPSPRIAAGVSRGGGLGVVDLGGPDPGDGWRRIRALAEAASWSAAGIGVRVPAGCPVSPDDARRAAGGRVTHAVLASGSPWDITETASWARVLAEVTSLDEAVIAAGRGAHGLVARGAESGVQPGGPVSELSAFVLVQQLLAHSPLPVWAAGGVGPYAAVGCVLGGAAGVVIDSQLGLMPESDLPGDTLRALRHADGSENVCQDAWLAGVFAASWRDTAAATAGIRAAIEAGVRLAGTGDAGALLAPGAPLATALGIRIPVVQGPMTRVSDTPEFAAAVAGDGALPMIALALADGDRAVSILRAAAAGLRGRPWGVGVLGFVPDKLRAAQLAAVLDVRPDCAIIAGGRPGQAQELEQAGIATFLHVPSPRLLQRFLEAGTRRFVFEGAECGGHIGPRTSFTLWESQLAVLARFLDEHPGTALPGDGGQPPQVLFAGGIHDARSAAMVAAMAAPVARRGVQVGVLMGTSYLFTAEAVTGGAVMPLFQRLATESTGTALLETSPGHVIRALRTPFTAEFAAERAAMEASAADKRESWERLELLNMGRLRLASKGTTHDGDHVDETAQAAGGLYMAGQVAALRNAPTTVPELQAAVTVGATELLTARAGELSALTAPVSGAGRGDSGGQGGSRPMDIALIGMAALFPGSPGTGAFWRLILSGEDRISEVPADRWDPAVYHAPSPGTAKPGRHTVSKWGGFLDPVPIDPLRYGIPPSALGSIDPSQLLALEVADQAMRDAGHPYDAPGADHSRTGVVFAAEPGSDDSAGLAMRSVLPAYLGEVPAGLDDQLPRFTEDTFPGHLANVIAGRIANRFDLGGPNFTVDAACAASLAAVDSACMHLGGGTADLMLCGAVDLHNSIGDFLMFGSVQALSPSGRVAAFDSSADGTALGEGVACVVLKRLADATRDGDRVYAVIKGVGAASDGRARSLTAPRPDGQIRAMLRAYRQAGVSPSDVGLVEAHGTGTPLGDRTELDSLTTVFTEAGTPPGSCVLGSVKSQIGHTKCAAGLAGLVKSALAVYYGVQPPTGNLTTPSAAWDPARSPFAFLAEPRPWLAPAGRRVAGLSAFGFGGTNYHVVLTGHDTTPEPRHGLTDWPAELLVFRGATRADVHRAVAALADSLEAASADPAPAPLRDLAARAARSAEASGGKCVAAVVARDTTELLAQLRRLLDGGHDPRAGIIQPPARTADTGSVAFLFPGQGSQRPGAMAELFVAFPELRRYLRLGERWAGFLFPGAAFTPEDHHQHAERLRDTAVAQPVLGVGGLAASHLLERLEVRPDMAGGHSYGELAALAVAGAFDPQTLLELSEARAAAMLSAVGDDPGAMAAVTGTAGEVEAAVRGHDVTLANINAPRQIVISGTTPAVTGALAALREKNITAKRLRVACAFHSPVVAGATARFAATLAGTRVSALRLPVWSNRTALPYPAESEAISAELAAQLSSAVRFSDQVMAMYEAGARVFVETGPGQVLTGLVGATLGDRPHLALACDAPGGRGQGLRAFLITVAQLACAGVPANLGWLFHGRAAADAPGPAAPSPSTAAPSAGGRPYWTVNGQLVRDRDGDCLPGATVPARITKEFSVSAPTSAAPATRAEMLAEYLRTSRDMIAAHRDVMLSFMGGPPATPAWPAEASASPRVLAEVVSAPVTAAGPAGAAEPAAPAAAPVAVGPPLMDIIIGLIGERTGYPADLIDPDLDLEADLSIDSIKRTEIAAEVATRLGITDAGESAIDELVRARTVRAIVELLEGGIAGEAPDDAGPDHAVPGAPGSSAAVPGRDGEAAAGTAAADAPGTPEAPSATEAATAPAESAGEAPLRLVPGLEPAPASASAAPLSGARFTLTGMTPVTEHLAGLLREAGAHADVRQTDEAGGGTADADGLIVLDGLGDCPDPAAPVVYPLIREQLTSLPEDAVDDRPGWVLAAGTRGNPGAAGLPGLFRTAAAEYPGRFARYAEFAATDGPADIARRLLAELLDTAPEAAVSHADGIRSRLCLSPAVLPGSPSDGDGRDAAASLGLNGESVIVLVGGGRGITTWFARQAAAAAGCQIELIGRTPLTIDPVPAAIAGAPDIAAAPDAPALRAALARNGMRSPSEIGRAAEAILARRELEATLAELRGLGARPRYHCADAQDEETIRRILKIVHSEHGRIDGLVFGAGIIDDHLIRDKDPEAFARVFDTKVTGARNVLSAVADLDCAPAFTVLYGSIAATFGSRGQADYAAANSALEALGAAWARQTRLRCLTVHWGPWAPAEAHSGMVSPELARQYRRSGMAMIDPREGARTLLAELAWGDPALTAVVYMAPLSDAG